MPFPSSAIPSLIMFAGFILLIWGLFKLLFVAFLPCLLVVFGLAAIEAGRRLGRPH